MTDVDTKVTECAVPSLEGMIRFVFASSVFKRNLKLYGVVLLGVVPIFIFTFGFWLVKSDQTLISFSLNKFFPMLILIALVFAGHLVFSAYVTARAFIKRIGEYESYDAFCVARWNELGNTSGFVSFPLSFTQGFLGVFVITLSMTQIFNFYI